MHFLGMWQGAAGWTAGEWIGLVTAAIAGLALWASISGPKRAADLTSAKLEGSITARLEEHANDIKEIKGEQVRQWEDISKVGKKVENIEGRLDAAPWATKRKV